MISLTLASIGCSRDPEPLRPILYDPGAEDMGADMSQDMQADQGGIPTGVRCERIDGESCPLPNARGVCVSNRCVLLACITGFSNCDDDPSNGCERSISTQDACGACDRSCRDAERCQLGTRGYICSAGIVCSSSRFDLDQDPDNACEWEVREALRTEVQPIFSFTSVERLAIDADKQAVIGVDPDGVSRLITSLDAGATEGADTSYAFFDPMGDADAIAPTPLGMAFEPVESAGISLLVGWPSEITYHQRFREGGGEPIDQRITHACVPADGFSPQEFQGADWLGFEDVSAMALLDDNLIPLVRCVEDEGLCLDATQSFGPADYVRMHYPYEDRSNLAVPGVIADARWSFAEGEVEQCLPCILDTEEQVGGFIEDKRCWGPAQCRGDDFDPVTECVACSEATSGCPDFSPVAVLPLGGTGDRLATITRRGLVVMAYDPVALRPLARLEEPFAPGVSSGESFVAGASAVIDDRTTRVFLLHNTGYIRALDVRIAGTDVSITSAAPDVGFDLDLGSRGVRGFVAIDEETLVMTGDIDALVIRVRARSARSETLTVDPDGSADGFFGAGAIEQGAELWRIRSGNLERLPVVEDE